MHKVGLRHDVHLAAFFFDVYVRTAVNDPSLITSSVASAAARCMVHLAKGDQSTAATLQQGLQSFEAGTNPIIAEK